MTPSVRDIDSGPGNDTVVVSFDRTHNSIVVVEDGIKTSVNTRGPSTTVHLFGNGGNDTIIGGNDPDVLVGGLGVGIVAGVARWG